ncbi:hypothetical protein U6A24_08000 [Aquimarina gracilis]|uniref:Uncharacterized protein n=1 Tax=Aquimarina gracilis TaxID=874422 RepID=A0ABU5ZTJ0_9FLAO|nr:hypothetical protein [Aquimarina gracilis]MEB3345395.1 hypothetical protein [Aquimarina gracilis]
MGSTIIFKRLFEVVILHDYFLTTVKFEPSPVKSISFFDRNKTEKDELISKKLSSNIYDIKDLFSIEPVGDTKKRMSEYKLLIAKTSLGFIVGTEIKVENKAGDTLYKPRIALKNDLNFTFSIKPQASFFKSVTNIGLRPTLPSIYYFTNKDKEEFDEGSYKSLPISNKVNTPQNGITYEMGALIDFGGTVREAIQYTDGTNPDHWIDVDDKRFVSNADRILLPHNFNFLVNESNVEQIEFVLFDKDDNEIKTINETSSEGIENVFLNLTRVDENDQDSDIIPDGIYTLKISANEEPAVAYTVYLNDEVYDKNSFAVVDIRLDELDSPFSLLDNEGYLKTRITAGDDKISHPIFEIRLKNRKTYWRYNKDGGFSNDDADNTSPFLKPDPDLALEKLISEDPKGLTETLVPFIKGSSNKFLPHPRMPAIKVEKDRIFSEIFISQSNRLLNN